MNRRAVNEIPRNPRRHSVWRWSRAAVFGLLSLLAAPGVHAQIFGSEKLSLESDFHFATLGNSAFKESQKIGSMQSYDFGTRDVFSAQVKEGVLFRFGVEYDLYNFSSKDQPALPSRLQEISAVIGLDLQLGDAWLARVEFQPGFYGDTLRAKDLDLPIVVGASYFYSANLQLMVGLSIDQERKYPVLPGIGFRWQISKDWVADVVFPTPRLEYSVTKNLTLYSGAELQSNSYRTGSTFGTDHGNPRLNNAIVDYDQIRVGIGASWKVRKELTVEFEAGFVPIQEFDFHRADVKARSTDVPPYGGVVLKFAF
jgi:hypothetical protein